MIGYYKKSIIKILTIIHQARTRPFESPQIWKTAQELLIKQSLNVENLIRKTKSKKKSHNQLRKNPNYRLSKEESILLKSQLSYLDYKLDEYKHLLRIDKDIGDAIPFTLINKHGIKPQNFKQSSGFISQKSGFKIEKKAFNYAYKKGGIAILNDLTSSLKYCDLTLIKEDGNNLAIEIKSSGNYNNRVTRQKTNAEKIFAYLSEDITENLYGNEGKIQRVSFESEEINYIFEINELIDTSRKIGFASKLVEPGVLYFVAHKDPGKSFLLTEEIEPKKLINPHAYFVNGMKLNELGYLPFSLSISNPENYFDFLQGNFVINIFIDYNVISKISLESNFTFKKTNDSAFPFEFSSVINNSKISNLKISQHMFYRTIV